MRTAPALRTLVGFVRSSLLVSLNPGALCPHENRTQVTTICAIKKKNLNERCESKWRIRFTLSDETVLDNLRLNGNNFISSSEINESVFDGNCSIVTINDGEKDEVHMNMELVQITKVDDKYWFVLREVPETELAFVKMQSDIEYVAMMSEIEL